VNINFYKQTVEITKGRSGQYIITIKNPREGAGPRGIYDSLSREVPHGRHEAKTVPELAREGSAKVPHPPLSRHFKGETSHISC
jgi:hypothetical protein